MSKLLNEIENYWSNRAEGYSDVNHEELAGEQKGMWAKVLLENVPTGKPKEEIKILDIGTGPGFFSIIMAEAGYDMTAVDYTEEMLVQARANSSHLDNKIKFMRMDAHELDFEDEEFDMIITRNLTWILEDPKKAYKEWGRVLKKGGKLLNFDANWYTFLYDHDKKTLIKENRNKMDEEGIYNYESGRGVDTDRMEELAMQVPLTAIERPIWDREVLTEIGFRDIDIDTEVGERVLSETELINYKHTPIFMINASK